MDNSSWFGQGTAHASKEAVLGLEARRAESRAAREAARDSRLGAPVLESLYSRAVDTVPATSEYSFLLSLTAANCPH